MRLRDKVEEAIAAEVAREVIEAWAARGLRPLRGLTAKNWREFFRCYLALRYRVRDAIRCYYKHGRYPRPRLTPPPLAA